MSSGESTRPAATGSKWSAGPSAGPSTLIRADRPQTVEGGGGTEASLLELSTWRSAVEEIGSLLVRVQGDPAAAAADARWLARHVAGVDPASWWLGLDSSPATHQRQQLRFLVSRRLAGEPVAYLMGKWSFRTLELEVGPGVLVPRPETEQVVDVALERLGVSRGGAAREQDREGLVADLGTGTGAIALAILSELPSARCWAVESEPAALAWARRNLDRYPDLSPRLRLCPGEWYRALPLDLMGQLDVVVSNPPYVSEGEYRSLSGQLGSEPASALVGGADGMSCVREILDGARSWLRPGGAVVMEVAESRADQVVFAAEEQGARSTRVHADLAGRPRVVVAEW